MHAEVRVFAPGTVANLGPGFDLLGLAIRGLGDTVVARRSTEPGVRMVEITGDGGKLSLDAAENTAAIAARETLKRAGVDVGIELSLHKGMPIGSGLGSSAASAAAGAMAANRLIGAPLRRIDLILPCVEAEATVSGRHADNVAPALLGGLVLIQSLDPLRIQRIPIPPGLMIVVTTPAFELSTRLARSVLPETVSMADRIRNAGNVATLISACYSGELSLLSGCIADEVVTPLRAALIPGAQGVIEAAIDAGALGASISGAGPSIFALCRSRIDGERIAAAMVAGFAKAGLGATAIVSEADCPGATAL